MPGASSGQTRDTGRATPGPPRRRGGPSLLGSCVGQDVTRLELVRTFTRYARAHPEDLGLRATAVLIPALSQKFPCPEHAEKGGLSLPRNLPG